MDINKYNVLREKIKNKDFEGKNKTLDKFLYAFSWIGNAGSIFFAYFLVFPGFLNAISANLIEGNFATYFAAFLTIIVLAIFELIKREVLSNSSFDLIKHKYRITKKFVGWLMFSLSLISASFYFSLNGAINFASTSNEKNIVFEENIDNKIDSLTLQYDQYKQQYQKDNTSLRESNVQLREKITSTPLNYRTVRKELNDLVEANLNTIELNNEQINNLNSELKEKILELKNNLNFQKKENKTSDIEGILLFLIISTSIELIIILGVFFRQYYDYNTFLINQSKIEDIIIKRERYTTLLKFIYNNGSLSQGEKITGVSKLQELVAKNSKIPSSNKFVKIFIDELTIMGILKLEGKRRYIAKSYEDALKEIEKFDENLRLLENLK